MAVIVNLNLFWIFFMSIIFTQSNSGNEIFINDAAKGYDTDFLPFMKKMFSGLPGQPTMNLEKKGPNAGYRPYWYAYNFVPGWMGKQKDTVPGASSHEDWDYGLGRGSAKGLWGGGKLSLLAAAGDDAELGREVLIDKDVADDDGDKNCFPNLGKSCKLGVPPGDYDADMIESLRKKTLNCDKCSASSKKVGTVCTVDKTGTVFQDTDMCIMDKMNCLGGTAVIHSENWRYKTKFMQYPFLMQPQWARISMKGWKDCDIKLFNKFPYVRSQYWVVVCGWPYSGPKSAIYTDCVEPYVGNFVWMQWGGDGINYYTYTEYTIVWNPQNGWFLMSQARFKDWPSKFYIEYVDPAPRDFKYIDAATGWYGGTMDIILHELMVLHTGPCVYMGSKDDFPSDSEEVYNHTMKVEHAYKTRLKILKAKGYKPEDWDAEDGSYIEY